MSSLGAFRSCGKSASYFTRIVLKARSDAPRFLSSKYRGGSKSQGAAPKQSREGEATFRKARETLARRRNESNNPRLESGVERVLFQREESIAQRFIGPLAMFNVAGALIFAVTIFQEGDLKRRERAGVTHPSGELKQGPGDAQRTAAIGVAGATAIAVVVAASRFTRSRLVELRAVGNSRLRLYIRSMSGFPFMVHEAAAGDVGVNFSRLRAAQKVTKGNAANKKNELGRETPFVSFRVTANDGSGKQTVYTIDSLDASVLDVDGIERLTTNLDGNRQ